MQDDHYLQALIFDPKRCVLREAKKRNKKFCSIVLINEHIIEMLEANISFVIQINICHSNYNPFHLSIKICTKYQIPLRCFSKHMRWNSFCNSWAVLSISECNFLKIIFTNVILRKFIALQKHIVFSIDINKCTFMNKSFDMHTTIFTSNLYYGRKVNAAIPSLISVALRAFCPQACKNWIIK